MKISEHPDFKQEVNELHCSHCEKVTEHKRGLRINPTEFDPPEYNECSVCGNDSEKPEE